MNNENKRGLAFDRASVRRMDVDGRMHVEVSNISKATVNPYRGDEIPDWEQLGLSPDRVYFLLRDPEELERAAQTFNNIPLLSKHIPVSAEDPQKEFVVGATGSNARYAAPYLKNSLVVWDAVAIALVESEDQKELSSAYRYRADMTPGKYEGVAYDGVMRDIRGNHVALVEVGRAGPDVVVGDSNTINPSEIPKMKQSKTAIAVAGALGAHIRPRLAADAAMVDLSTMLKGVTRKNLQSETPRIVRALQNRFAGKLAQDADLEDLKGVIEVFCDPGQSPIGEDEDDETRNSGESEKARENEVALDDNLLGKLRESLGEMLGHEDMEKVMKALGAAPSSTETAKDEPPHTPETPEAPVTKAAMDAAMQRATTAGEMAALSRMNAIRTAEQECRTILGDIVAQDSAEDVYRLALDAKGIDTDGVPPAAFRHMVKLALSQDQAVQSPRVAMDAAAVQGFDQRYPNAKKMKVI